MYYIINCKKQFTFEELRLLQTRLFCEAVELCIYSVVDEFMGNESDIGNYLDEPEPEDIFVRFNQKSNTYTLIVECSKIDLYVKEELASYLQIIKTNLELGII